ncbi:amidase [Antarcticimicrobium luteum]|uniref:amidase n=1 Tax=Antarcticimicrobium luteum TaxID=2547397 RepID=UPI00140CFEF7|nr:amidase [Antarcticimicrobium luteum]
MPSLRPKAREIVESHIRGQTTCEETVSGVFAQLPRIQEGCNAFTEWFPDEALETARALDRKRAQGAAPGLLHGVPICIKDMTPTKGHHTTLGSWTSGEGKTFHDAVIVQRLKAAGAIIVGKTTTAELAFSSFTNTARYGVTRNPWDLTRTSGGSSGGSAAAVASGVVPLAEGTDMGGSVRIPAAACGVVGFKPSLGRIPMDIVPSALETLSHFGALAASVEDAARFVAAGAGHHPSDMLSRRSRFDLAATAPKSLAGKRFALSADLGYCAVDPEIQAGLMRIADRLRRAGAVVDEVDLPWTRDIFDQWAIRWFCLLATFPNARTAEQRAQMHPELAAGLEQARSYSAMDLMGVDLIRSDMNRQLNSVFAQYDVLLCPTNAVPAPPVTQSDADFEKTLPDGKLRAFDMTHPFNMVPTSPVLSLPIGLTEGRLPIGMQIVGPPFEDEAVLSAAATIEALIDPLPVPQF